MNILLVQLDGKLPNIALMRIAAHHRALGDEVTLRHGGERGLWDADWDKVYGSAIFEKSMPAVERLFHEYPGAIVGGTGYDVTSSLESHGIATTNQDYSIYPDFRESIGFTQRGCRLKCSFCVVPRKEGSVREVGSIYDLWRGDPWPRDLHILDNDFFGQPRWRERIAEIRDGSFRVSFSQGINARCLTEEAAEAIASVNYQSANFNKRRVYTAWDNLPDEGNLFAGLSRLVKYGVKPGHITVYMLIGYWPGETAEARDYRRAKLREFGCDPYPMPFVRTTELIGFQRFVVDHYDKRWSWKQFAAAGYRPERLNSDQPTFPLLEAS